MIEFRDPDTGTVRRRVSGAAGDRYTAIAPTYWDQMFVAATGNVLQGIPGARSSRTCEGTLNY